MKDNRFDTKTDRIIQASMKLADEPAGELNRKLKEALYRKEKAMQNQPAMCRLSLWYLPMVFNLILFGMLAVAARMMIGNVSVLLCCRYLPIYRAFRRTAYCSGRKKGKPEGGYDDPC